jgi:hypothetical protein
MFTITLVSLVVAAVSGFLAWRCMRRERLRSDARVASLAAAIDGIALPAHIADPTQSVDYTADFRSEAGEITFEAIEQPPVRRRLLLAGSSACVVVAGVVWIAMMSDRYEPPAAPVVSVVSPHAESLELLSLQAARDGSTLAVTGLVRSRADEPLTTLTAVVSAIDAKGRPIGRGSVPLTTILPRRESRFVVTIGDVGDASRYRVSFRSATGVIRHVDRRAQRSSAVL